MRDRMTLRSPSWRLQLRPRGLRLPLESRRVACIYLSRWSRYGATYGRARSRSGSAPRIRDLAPASARSSTRRSGAAARRLSPAGHPSRAGWSATSRTSGRCAPRSQGRDRHRGRMGACTAFVSTSRCADRLVSRRRHHDRVAVAAALSAVAIYLVLLSPARTPRNRCPLHGGVGAFSTYLVLVVPSCRCSLRSG